MFLGWGALTGFVLVVAFPFVASLAPEPVALILGVMATAFVFWLSLRAAFDRGNRTR